LVLSFFYPSLWFCSFFALILKYGFNDTENLLLRQIQIVCFGRHDEVIPRKTFILCVHHFFGTLFANNSTKC
jgi:hypothetical protein